MSVLAGLLGAALGVGGYTFVYARGYAYLQNNPAVCANCHVMREQYDGWVHSSHRSVATCNDCHTPHSLIPKYLVKAENGFRHSFAFTTGRFHEPIRITPTDRQVTENACRYCHERVVAAIDPDARHKNDRLSCIQCHRNVGHMH
jgi:cytochrome c nitrite reductase small subunit